MWTVIYVAQSKEQAEKIRKFLQDASILVKIRSANQNSAENFGCYEIMVPESEIDEAHGIIIQNI